MQDELATVFELMRTADRLEELAETATLMGDHDGALRLRTQAATARLEAMQQLDG